MIILFPVGPGTKFSLICTVETFPVPTQPQLAAVHQPWNRNRHSHHLQHL